MKIDETRGRLEFEEQKLNNNMTAEKQKQSVVHQHLNVALDKLHVHTDTTNAKAMALNRRIDDIERMIGVRACVDDATGKPMF